MRQLGRSSTSHELAEGPGWDEESGLVHWVDILGGSLHQASPTDLGSSGETVIQIDGHLSVATRVEGSVDRWLVAADQGFGIVEGDRLRRCAQPEAEASVATRFNDGACDPAGRFLAGSMAYDGTPGAGSLYRIGLDGTIDRVLTGLTISNGLGWAPDGSTMYLVDTGPATITAFEYDVDTGAIGGSEVIAGFDEANGSPDGLCVDADGCLWVAFWGGGRIARFAPDGTELSSFDIGTPMVTSCAFVGPGLDQLLVSTAWYGMSEADRLSDEVAGRLILIEPGVTGLPSKRFAGTLPEIVE